VSDEESPRDRSKAGSGRRFFVASRLRMTSFTFPEARTRYQAEKCSQDNRCPIVKAAL
jgi:hypothetical protein